jgi:23S rRNA (cytidine1920-2'-O)/16S rRNA (cytidine1409-2'-O)-methyltransferase
MSSNHKTSNEKIRLSELLVSRGLFADAVSAERAVLAGDVSTDGARLVHPKERVSPALALYVKRPRPFVSRGGEKLEGALADFSFDPAGLRCLDAGASTGGFTDCLLRHGAQSVLAVDVAYGQLAWELRRDERVRVLERTTIRDIDVASVGGPFDLVVADLSFTPLCSAFAALATLLAKRATLIALVKPQFELPASQVPSGGVVVDPSAHIRALEKVMRVAAENDLAPQAVTFSPIKGAKGNIEFFLQVLRAGIPVTIALDDVVTRAHTRLD